MNHRNNFNVLRLIAAIFVVISHTYMVIGRYESEPLRMISNNTIIISTIGLYIFFFISGFLVTKSALESDNVMHFLFKRFLRIYPALIILVLISVFILGPLLTRLTTKDFFLHEDSWKYLWTMSGLRIRIFLPGVFDTENFHNSLFNIPLWSISLELKLYFSLGILLFLKLIHKKQRHIYISILVIAILSIIILFEDYLNKKGLQIDYKQLKLAITFYVGSLIQISNVGNKKLTVLFILSLLSFLLRALDIIDHTLILDEILVFSIFTYFLAFAESNKVVITNDLSYGIYIFTFPIQQVYFQLSNYNNNPILNIALSLTTSLFLAYLSWKYIEKPCLNLKDYYYRFIPFISRKSTL